MSRERQRTRAAREAARAAQREQAERQRAKAHARQRRVTRLKLAVPTPGPSRRRPRALPTRVKLGLALGWLLVQVLAWQVIDEAGPRVGFAIVTAFAVPLIVVLVYNPARRYR